MVRKKQDSQPIEHAGGVFFFILIATLLWSVIKLSAEYTVTENITINYKDQPSELVILDDTKTMKMTIATTGFDLLHFYLKPSIRRKVEISLEKVPLQQESKSTYSFSSSHLREPLATYFNFNPNEISFDESKVILTMETLNSKKVKIIPNIEISYEKQYNRHGKIITTPDSTTIYGPKNIIEQIDNITTEHITLKNINSKIDIDIPLQIKENINTAIDIVNIKIDVDKYTEAVANIPIKSNSQKKLRMFPDKVKIKYIVSLTDYNIINDQSFKVEIDTSDISPENNYLPIYLTDYPNNTRITSIEPKEVEYIIIEENEYQ